MKYFYQNHILSTLLVLIILASGLFSYFHLAREKAPSVSFHWAIIQTSLPGANAQTVESVVTTPIEEALSTVADIDFMISQSQQTISDIMVRFNTLSDDIYESRNDPHG